MILLGKSFKIHGSSSRLTLLSKYPSKWCHMVFTRNMKVNKLNWKAPPPTEVCHSKLHQAQNTFLYCSTNGEVSILKSHSTTQQALLTNNLCNPGLTCWMSAHPHLGLFALHDRHTRVGGSQVDADNCAFHGFWPTKAYTLYERCVKTGLEGS